jgi:hypothetical protein
MPAVSEHRQLHPLGAPVVEEGVDRRAHGPAGEEDVVDEDDGESLEVEVQVRGEDDRLGVGCSGLDVVAVERDVEVAERELLAGQLAHQRVDALRQDRAARVDADDRYRFRGVLLHDLVRNPHQRAAQVLSVEDDLLRVTHSRPFLVSPDRVKGTDVAETSRGSGARRWPEWRSFRSLRV